MIQNLSPIWERGGLYRRGLGSANVISTTTCTFGSHHSKETVIREVTLFKGIPMVSEKSLRAASMTHELAYRTL